MDLKTEYYINQAIGCTLFVGAGICLSLMTIVSIIFGSVTILVSFIYFIKSFIIHKKFVLENIPEREKCDHCNTRLSKKGIERNFCYVCAKTAKNYVNCQQKTNNDATATLVN